MTEMTTDPVDRQQPVANRSIEIMAAPLELDRTDVDSLNHLLDWQRVILSLNNHLLTSPSDKLDDAIHSVLATIGHLTASDRTYVFRIRDTDRLDNSHEWTAPGIDPMIEVLQDLPVEVMDDWRSAFDEGYYVYIPAVADLPLGSTIREILEPQDIQSLLAIPMYRDARLMGFVGLDAVRSRRSYAKSEVALLESVTNSICIALGYQQAAKRQAEAMTELEYERDRLSLLFKALPDLLLETDPEGRFVGYHFGVGSHPAMPAEAFMGRIIEDVLPPELAMKARALMEMADRAEAPAADQYSMTVDGEERWFAVSAGRMGNKSASPGFVFLIRDITDLQRSHAETRRLGEIARRTSNPVVITDAAGRISWVNPAFESTSGWSLNELRGQAMPAIPRSPLNDSANLQFIDERLRNGEAVQAEVAYLTKSGATYWAKIDVQPHFDAHGTLDSIIGIQTDITHIKNAHDEELQQRLAAIEAADNAIAILDRDGQYTYMNPSHRRLFKLPEDTPLAEIDWRTLLPPPQADELRENVVRDLMATGKWRGELVGIDRGGSSIELEATVILTSQKSVVYVLSDITARKEFETHRLRLRQELQKAERREAVAHIAASVAHDLNNLIAVIAGTVNLIKERNALGPDDQNDLTRLGSAIEAANTLVSRLSKLEQRTSQKRPVNLSLAINEALDLVQAKSADAHTMITRFKTESPFIWADPTELLQVLFNLIINSADAGPPETNQISITVEDDLGVLKERWPDIGHFKSGQRYALIKIDDTGSGVLESFRPRMFERFATTKGASGTGLGLSIVASIVRDSNAVLWFDTSYGVGSTVSLAWPRTEAVTYEKQHETRSSERKSLLGLCVMVVDDNVTFGDFLANTLENSGAIAIAVETPHEALELVRSEPTLWSAIVTDYDMPGLNGSQLAAQLRKIDNELPCILVTAVPSIGESECDQFEVIFRKPLDHERLIKSLVEVSRR